MKAFSLLFSLSMVACYPKAAPAPEAVTQADIERATKKWPKATEQALVHGREVFLAKCNNCHAYPDRNAVDEAEWPAIVKRMGERAKLSADDTEHVLHFILASRSAASK